MPARPPTFSTPENPFVVTDDECVIFNVMLFTVRPRTMLSVIGAVIDDVIVSPPRPGNTFMFCVSLWRYCSCPVRITAVPRPWPPRPAPPGPPRPPNPPPNPPGPPRPPRPPGCTVRDRFCVKRRLTLSDDVWVVVDT